MLQLKAVRAPLLPRICVPGCSLLEAEQVRGFWAVCMRVWTTPQGVDLGGHRQCPLAPLLLVSLQWRTVAEDSSINPPFHCC